MLSTLQFHTSPEFLRLMIATQPRFEFKHFFVELVRLNRLRIFHALRDIYSCPLYLFAYSFFTAGS